ncbi:hypothetical protein ACN6AT_37390 (plasmid) [Streptomyces sp. JL4002]|uniref:hypothetical protein n=1 Tax=Streptomyces sp. JL4002 TaxID=3404781 RepID=UPI003B27B465
MEPTDWAGTTTDEYDLHRFPANQQALCDPAIRTYSNTLRLIPGSGHRVSCDE